MNATFSINKKLNLLLDEVGCEQSYLIEKISDINNKILEISDKNNSTNDKYEKEFKNINIQVPIKNIDEHLKMIYFISKSEEVLLKCLKYIVVLFPELSDIKSDIIDENPYK